MTKKTYLVVRVAIIVALCAVITWSMQTGTWQLPVVTMLAAWALLFTLRKKVKGVQADERDYRLAGRAALHAITGYSFVAAPVGLALRIGWETDPVLFALGSMLLNSAALLILLYVILYRIYERKGNAD